uniref:Ggt1_1 protein n=1 Tax=Fopius arisanus TaxID=64838 RepID=A0A0C9R2T6_9HYME
MLLFLLLICVQTEAYTEPINIVTNNPICTDMSKKYINEYPHITTPELFIIASVCEGIVHPMDSGLGGGFQAVIHRDGTTNSWYINSRERAGMHHNFPSQPGKTSKHIGVPSMLRGYAYLYNNICNFGYKDGPALSWRQLFRENIKLAYRGFAMSKTLINVINVINLAKSPWRYNVTSQQLTSPILGTWIDKISHENPKNLSFYHNNTQDNDNLVDELREIGSSLRRSDISNYRVNVKSANKITCLDYTIYTTKVPGSGVLQLFGCKIIEYAIKNYNYVNWPSAQRFIFNIKTLQYIQALQPHIKYLTHQAKVTNSKPLSDLLYRDSAYIAQFLYKYNTPISLYPPMQMGKTKLHENQITLAQKSDERGTSNICIKDRITSFCATSTINWGFGSCIASRHFGFFYNNQLSDFTYKNNLSFNRPMVGSQPLSSISPVIFTKTRTNKFEFAMGAAGGRKIIPSIFTMMSSFIYEYERNKIDSKIQVYNCNRDQFISRCVFHIKPYEYNSYMFLECEDSLHPILRQTLLNYRALIKYSVEAGYSSVTTLTKTHGCFDPRRGGKALK